MTNLTAINGLSVDLEDYGIIEEFNVDSAEVETFTQDVPGRNGVLDMSEALTGAPVYKKRTIEIKLASTDDDKMAFNRRRTELSNKFHGRRCYLTLPDDPGYRYEGRVTVEGQRIDSKKSEITVTMIAYPFKKKIAETVVTATITTAGTVVLNNERERTIPEVEVDSEMTISLRGRTKALQPGHYLLDLILEEGRNEVSVKGNGTITFSYREGAL